MRIHYLIHAEFEKLGIIRDWANDNGFKLRGTNTYLGEKLPSLTEFDFLIVMGGPQSACELHLYPYLQQEITLIQQAIAADKTVLGICLGAQLIAEALGGKTERSPYKEVGVFPIMLTEAASHDGVFKNFPTQFSVMHWHNDMPGVASEMVWLAQSEGCPRQAFRYKNNVYGLQFHAELTQDLVKSMLSHCPEDLQPAPFVSSPSALLVTDLSDINQKMYTILNRIASIVIRNK